MWVIQETVLARKATVYLGDISAPWTMLADGSIAYVQQLTTINPAQYCQEYLNMSISNPVRNYRDARDSLSALAKAILDLESVRIAKIEDHHPPLLSMLRRFRPKRSTDPRDKVFAILGLASERIRDSFKPD